MPIDLDFTPQKTPTPFDTLTSDTRALLATCREGLEKARANLEQARQAGAKGLEEAEAVVRGYLRVEDLLNNLEPDENTPHLLDAVRENLKALSVGQAGGDLEPTRTLEELRGDYEAVAQQVARQRIQLKEHAAQFPDALAERSRLMDALSVSEAELRELDARISARSLERELGWNQSMLTKWFIAATEAAAVFPNRAVAEGRFEKLIWTLHIGLKLLDNWESHRSGTLGRRLLDPSWTPSIMLQPRGKGPVWRLHRLVDEYVRSRSMLSFPYLSGFEATLTLQDLPAEDKELHISQVESYLHDPDAFESPMGAAGQEILRSTYRMIANRYPDAEPAFRRQITKTASIPDWLKEVYPALPAMGLFLRESDLE